MWRRVAMWEVWIGTVDSKSNRVEESWREGRCGGFGVVFLSVTHRTNTVFFSSLITSQRGLKGSFGDRGEVR